MDIDVFDAWAYISQPVIVLTYTAAVLMCQGLVAAIRWSDRMVSRQQ